MAKLWIIGDRLTVTGMELAGLKNMEIANQENIEDKIMKIDENMDVILITQSLAKHASKQINELRKQDKIVVEIPDRSGEGDATTSKIVKDVIGFDFGKWM